MAEKLKFVKVEIPLIKQEVEVLAVQLKELENKTIKLDLTRQLRGKAVEAVFRIRVDGEKLIGLPFRLRIFGFYIRRMMRKGIDYIEDSFKLNSKDSSLTIKLFMITRKKIHKKLKNAIRLKARALLEEEFKEKETGKIFEEILLDKLQKSLAQKLKKIYPLTFCDIRDIFIVSKK